MADTMDLLLQGLKQEEQKMAAQNPYLTTAQGLASFRPDYKGASSGEAAAASLIHGLLTGISGGYGQQRYKNDVSQLRNDYTSAMSSSDPYESLMANENLQSLAPAYQRHAQEQAQDLQQQRIKSLQNPVTRKVGDGTMEQQFVVDPQSGEMVPFDIAGPKWNPRAKGTTINVGDPLSKVVMAGEDRLRGELLDSPAYKDVAEIEKGYKALKEISKEKSAISDVGLISTIARIWDPGSTVREGEFKITERAAQDVFTNFKGEINRAIYGGAKLSDKTREAMIDAARRKLNSQEVAYNELAERVSNIAERRGLNVNNILPRPIGTTGNDTQGAKYSADEMRAAGYSEAEIDHVLGGE